MNENQDIMEMQVPGRPVLDKIQVTTITKHNLDTALEDHTSNFDHYTSEIPHIRFCLSQLKTQISRERNRLVLALKDNTSAEYADAENTYSKVTEKVVESIVATDKDICGMEDRLNEWQRALNERERIRDIFLARESSIRAMIQLYISGYWGPSTRGEDSQRVNGTDKPKRDPISDMGRGTRDSRRQDYDTRHEDRQEGGRKRFRRRAQ